MSRSSGRQGLAATTFPLSSLHQRTRQQTLTQIDFISPLPREDLDSESSSDSEDDYPKPAAKRRRVQLSSRNVYESSTSNTPRSRESTSKPSIPPPATRQEPRAALKALKTPEKRKRFAEIPSSESPPETPLVEHNEQCSPLKERDNNSQSSMQGDAQQDDDESWLRRSDTKRGARFADLVENAADVSADSQDIDSKGVRHQSTFPGTTMDQKAITRLQSHEHAGMKKSKTKSRELDTRLVEKNLEEIPDSEYETDDEESHISRDSIEESKVTPTGPSRGSGSITQQMEANAGESISPESQTRMIPDSLDEHAESLNQEESYFVPSYPDDSEALDAQLRASLQQFSTPCLDHSAQTSFITADSHSSQPGDPCETADSSVFIGSSQQGFPLSQTDSNFDESSPHRRRYTGDVSITQVGKVWTDSQLLPATLMDGSLLPMPPFQSQSSILTGDDARD